LHGAQLTLKKRREKKKNRSLSTFKKKKKGEGPCKWQKRILVALASAKKVSVWGGETDF